MLAACVRLGHLALQHLEHHLERRHAREGRPARDELDRRDPERPHVRRAIVAVRLLQDLWGHPPDAAPHEGLPLAPALAVLDQVARQPKVGEPHGALAVDEDVARPQLPVNDVVPVQVAQPIEDLAQDAGDGRLLKAARAQLGHDLAAPSGVQLQHHPELAASDEGGVEPHQVRVHELTHPLDLLLRARQLVAGRLVQILDLDRHIRVGGRTRREAHTRRCNVRAADFLLDRVRGGLRGPAPKAALAHRDEIRRRRGAVGGHLYYQLQRQVAARRDERSRPHVPLN